MRLEQNVFSVTKIFVTKSPVFHRQRPLATKSTNFVIETSSLKVLAMKHFITNSLICPKNKKKKNKTFSNENVSSLNVFLAKNSIQ